MSPSNAQKLLQKVLEDQGFELIESEEEFLTYYPKPLWGCYRPQPDSPPDNYPVMLREESIIDCDNCDRAILSYVYL